MNFRLISNILSSSLVYSFWVCLYSLQLVWIFIRRKLHFFLLVLYRSESDFLKSSFNPLSVLCTSCQMLYLWMASQKLLNTGLIHLTVFLSVDFVADQNEWEFFWLFWCSLIQKFSDPRLNIVKRLSFFEFTLLFVMS